MADSPTPPGRQRPLPDQDPEDVELATETALESFRTRDQKLSFDALVSLQNGVALDIRAIHQTLHDVTKYAADRFEVVERQVQDLEAAVTAGVARSFERNGTATLVGQSSQVNGTLNHTSVPTTTSASEPVSSLPSGTTAETSENPAVAPETEATPKASSSEAFSRFRDSGRRFSTSSSPDSVFEDTLDTPRPPVQRKKSVSYMFNVLGAKAPHNLTTFSGAPEENFAAFYRAFTDHVNAAKETISSEKQLSILLTYLTDFARDKAEEVVELSDCSYQKVVDHLKATFQDPNRAEMERQQLRNCSQRSDESVDAFGARVRKLAQSAYSHKPRDFVQEKAKEAFVDGLTPVVKFHVKTQSPRDFQEAQNAAVKLELLLAEAAKANTINPQGLSVALPPALVAVQDQMYNPPALQPPHFRKQQPQQFGQRKKGNCYYCGIQTVTTVEYAAECRRKQQESSRGYSNGNFNRGGQQNNRNYRGGPRQFPVNDPVQRHQLPSTQPQANSYVNSFAPMGDPLVEQLRADLASSHSQIEALVKRNAELAAVSVPPPASRRINLISVIPSMFTLTLLFTMLTLITPASAFSPLLCFPHAPETHLKLPSPIDCDLVLQTNNATQVEPLDLAIYRDNTIPYRSNGTFCKIVKRTTRFSTNFFGARWQESETKQMPVSSETCRNMEKFQSCEYGELKHVGGVFMTNNPHVLDWPSAPFSAFQGTQVTETTNCFMMPVPVSARFGDTIPTTPTGSMEGCSYSHGSCNTREGSAYIWKPIKEQECRFVFWRTIQGAKTGRIWLSDDKEMSLSYDEKSPSSKACGKKLILTDQGYAVGFPIRRKRQTNAVEDVLRNMTSTVTSNQLSAQLLAVEIAALKKTGRWFQHNFKSFCSSSNSYTAAILSAVASNPTIAARKLTGKEDIEAKWIGQDFLAVKACNSLLPSAFQFQPFKETCYSKPQLRVTFPNNATILTFVDLNTRIITNRAHTVDCNLVTDFEYVANGTLTYLNPFTLEARISKDFHPQIVSPSTEFQLSPLGDDPQIFHNMVIRHKYENMRDSQYGSIVEALQGSSEAMNRVWSTKTEEASSSTSVSEIKEQVDYWIRAKYIFDWIFFVWTIACNVLLTVLVLIAILCGVVRTYLGPWLFSPRFKGFNPSATIQGDSSLPDRVDTQISAQQEGVTPGPDNNPTKLIRTPTPIPDCVSQLRRLQSPAVHVMSVTGSQYITAQIPIRVNGISFWALVDTGAGFTIASKEVCALIGVPRLNPPLVGHALGLGGNEVEIAGSATVKFQIGSFTTLHCTNFTSGQCCPEGVSNYDFILGNDILSLLPKFHLDYANGSFEFGNERLPMGIQRNQTVFPSRYEVHVARDTVIPPRSESFVKCVVPLNNTENDMVLLSQASTLAKMDLIIAPAVFCHKNPILLVTNPTNEPKILYANTTAASATDINEVNERPSVLYYA